MIAKLGSITDTLTLTGGYAYANDFEVRLRALTDLARDWRLSGTGLIVGGINFAWLAVWVLSPNWLSRKSEFCRRLSEAAEPGGGMRAVPRLCIVYPGICLTTEQNHGKPQSGYPKSSRLISAERDSFSRLGHSGRSIRIVSFYCGCLLQVWSAIGRLIKRQVIHRGFGCWLWLREVRRPVRKQVTRLLGCFTQQGQR